MKYPIMLTAAAMLFCWRLYQRHWQAAHGTDDGRCSQDLPEGRGLPVAFASALRGVLCRR